MYSNKPDRLDCWNRVVLPVHLFFSGMPARSGHWHTSKTDACPREARMDLLINLLVAGAIITINRVAAVGFGMFIASALFIFKTGRSVIKRRYFADHFHSRKMRPAQDMKLLEEKGGKISILQLQGPIFFGSAEHLSEKSRDLYILIKGLITVTIYLPERRWHKRLFTFSSGTFLGEMSFLDGSPRSAGILAHEDSEVLCLSFADFEILSMQHPQIAEKMHRNIALELSGRLRRLSNQFRQLEDN